MADDDRKPHWNLSRTPERVKLMADLRRRLDLAYPGKGKRQNDALTTAQILDWALEDLERKLTDMGID